ncbi:hypothetical protein FQY83_11195 [Luteimonas marina]|uniref:Uncharacterized protein n=1 Tax=Luteimonas marina TaxID=488485 RepID=A0A5C5U1P0_9GAMM|nr:hypothetical protein [Luteimonas marina]TWT20291.1 hypothetical protein FQY83_11195 [Luteimonas marina]
MAGMEESSVLLRSSTMFGAAVAAASRLREQFSDAGVTVNPTSGLARLIDDSIRFAQNPLAEVSSEKDVERAMLRGQYLDRIARAASVLLGRDDAKDHLWTLKKDALDPGDRSPSRAKDKLWELELLCLLGGRGIPAEICEPDLVVTLESGCLALACKRIYSAKNAESQLSTGVKQIEKSATPGLLAVCIDDVLPPYCIVDAQDPANAAAFLDNHNIDFLNIHHVRLAKYIASRRISGVLVSSSAPIRHPPLTGEIASSTQMTMWTTPECDLEQLKLFEDLRSSMFESGVSESWYPVMGPDW